MPHFNNASNADILERILTAWDTPGEMRFNAEESRAAGDGWNVYTSKAGNSTLYASECGDGYTYFGVSDAVNGFTHINSRKI